MDAENRTLLEYLAKNISYITPFDGNKYNLAGFLSRVESFIPIIEPLDNASKVIVLGYILDKIVGKAKETLIKTGTVTTWAELKSSLIRNHGERTPITDLIDELKFCRCDSTVELFYNKITSLLCRINNAYMLNGEGNAVQIAENQRLALKQFIQGLPPLPKNLVGCHNPQTLDDAFDLLVRFGYLNITHDNLYPRQNSRQNNNFKTSSERNRNNHQNPHRNNNFPNRSNNNSNNTRSNDGNFNNNANSNRSNNNFRSPNLQYNHDEQNQNYPRNNQTQSIQTRRSNNSNNLRQNPQVNSPEPMDISTNESSNINSDQSQNFHFDPTNNFPI